MAPSSIRASGPEGAAGGAAGSTGAFSETGAALAELATGGAGGGGVVAPPHAVLAHSRPAKLLDLSERGSE
jgi:hypothetical protein